MPRIMRMIFGVALLVCGAETAAGQQLGKYVAIAAGSEEDRALMAINAETDGAKKLALIDQFAKEHGQGDVAIVADELYVNYYLGEKNYDQAFAYGDKLFAADPGNFTNAVNMVRGATEKGDVEKLFVYGEKASEILKAYRESAAPAETTGEAWADRKKQTLESNKDQINYVVRSVYAGAYQTKELTKRADLLVRFAKLFPDTPEAGMAMGVSASAYQQAQNTPKMLETANGLLTREPNNIGILILLADYYSEKGEQLDKAEEEAKKAVALLGAAQPPEGVSAEEWRKQSSLQKGLALSALGEVNLQKKDNGQAAQHLQTAAPLLKPADNFSFARNQYRLGFALINLKKNAEAKQAFADAASVNTPYKALAEEKLKTLSGPARPRRKAG